MKVFYICILSLMTCLLSNAQSSTVGEIELGLIHFEVVDSSEITDFARDEILKLISATEKLVWKNDILAYQISYGDSISALTQFDLAKKIQYTTKAVGGDSTTTVLPFQKEVAFEQEWCQDLDIYAVDNTNILVEGFECKKVTAAWPPFGMATIYVSDQINIPEIYKCDYWQGFPVRTEIEALGMKITTGVKRFISEPKSLDLLEIIKPKIQKTAVEVAREDKKVDIDHLKVIQSLSDSGLILNHCLSSNWEEKKYRDINIFDLICRLGDRSIGEVKSVLSQHNLLSHFVNDVLTIIEKDSIDVDDRLLRRVLYAAALKNHLEDEEIKKIIVENIKMVGLPLPQESIQNYLSGAIDISELLGAQKGFYPLSKKIILHDVNDLEEYVISFISSANKASSLSIKVNISNDMVMVVDNDIKYLIQLDDDEYPKKVDFYLADRVTNILRQIFSDHKINQTVMVYSLRKKLQKFYTREQVNEAFLSIPKLDYLAYPKFLVLKKLPTHVYDGFGICFNDNEQNTKNISLDIAVAMQSKIHDVVPRRHKDLLQKYLLKHRKFYGLDKKDIHSRMEKVYDKIIFDDGNLVEYFPEIAFLTARYKKPELEDEFSLRDLWPELDTYLNNRIKVKNFKKSQTSKSIINFEYNGNTHSTQYSGLIQKIGSLLEKDDRSKYALYANYPFCFLVKKEMLPQLREIMEIGDYYWNF